MRLILLSLSLSHHFEMSAVLSALPDLPPLIPAGTKINGKPIRIPPRVNLSDLSVPSLIPPLSSLLTSDNSYIAL